MGFFGNVKRRMDQREDERHIAKAGKLSALRTERLKREGRVKVNKAYDQEKGRIKAAKKEEFKSSYLGKAVSGVQKFQAASKKRSKARGGTKSPMQKTEINEAFSLGSGGKKKKFFYE